MKNILSIEPNPNGPGLWVRGGMRIGAVSSQINGVIPAGKAAFGKTYAELEAAAATTQSIEVDQ